MLKSRPLIIQIQRPYDDAYAFLCQPTNLVVWGGAELDSTMTKVGENDYLVDLPRGRRMMRFTPPNAFGVLDYMVFEADGRPGPVMPLRLHANGDGCELVLIWLQRPGVSDERFESEYEWTASDLLRLKTYMEAMA